MSKSRGKAPAESLVCRVDNTKWPVIEEVMAKATFDSQPDLDVYLQTDAEARRIATELMHHI